MSAEEPLEIFRRPLAGRVAGFIVYALLVPVFVCVFALPLTLGAGFGLKAAGVAEKTAWGAALAVGALATVAIVVAVVRGYLRRASEEFRVFPDRIDRSVRGAVESFPFADVASIELPPEPQEPAKIERVQLRTSDGRWLRMGRDWPSERREAFADRIEDLVASAVGARLSAEIERGEEVAFPEPLGRAHFYGIAGALIFLIGLVGLVGLGWLTWQGGTKRPHNLVRGVEYCVIAMFVGAASIARWRAAHGGGLLLSKRGVRRRADGSDPGLAWSEVRAVVEEARGLRVDGESGAPCYKLSRWAPNYVVALGLLRDLAPRTAFPATS